MITSFVLGIDWLFFLMIAGVTVAGLVEFFSLLKLPHTRAVRNLALAVSLGYLLAGFWCYQNSAPEWAAYLDGMAIVLYVFLIFGYQLRHPIEGRATLDLLAASLLGFVYITILFGFIAKILYLDLGAVDGRNSAPIYVLFLLAVTKFTDMGAYLVGSLIGKHKMIPHISPGKTWQGFFGALLFAYAASYGCLWIFSGHLTIITYADAAVLTLVLALASVLGDLAESIIKRSLAAKDSGKVMPGIGGVLDLVDSILFSAPLLYFYLVWRLGAAA